MRPPRRTMQPIGQETAERQGSQPVIVPPVPATAAPAEGALLRRPRASEQPVNVPVFDITDEDLA